MPPAPAAAAAAPPAPPPAATARRRAAAVVPPDAGPGRPALRLVADRDEPAGGRAVTRPLAPRIGATLVTARSFREYVGMFELSRDDLDGQRVLDCPGGAASFVADARRHGVDAVAVDPVYAMPQPALSRHVRDETRRANRFGESVRERFDWSPFGGVEAHHRERTAALERFLAHRGREPGRYVTASLPRLPAEAGAFDLALSSHLLFTYDDRLDLAFHVAAALELLRVVRREVRVYPLLSSATWRRSALVGPLLDVVRAAGHEAEVRDVGWTHQRGADEVLVLSRGPLSH